MTAFANTTQSSHITHTHTQTQNAARCTCSAPLWTLLPTIRPPSRDWSHVSHRLVSLCEPTPPQTQTHTAPGGERGREREREEDEKRRGAHGQKAPTTPVGYNGGRSLADIGRGDPKCSFSFPRRGGIWQAAWASREMRFTQFRRPSSSSSELKQSAWEPRGAQLSAAPAQLRIEEIWLFLCLF